MLRVWRRFMMIGAAHALGGVLATDQMPFHQVTCFLQRGKDPGAILKNESRISGNSSTRGLINSRTCVRSAFLAQPGKARCPKIPREPDSAADDDLMVGPFAAQPFAAGRHDVGKFHT